jgi:hypothetical protein
MSGGFDHHAEFSALWHGYRHQTMAPWGICMLRRSHLNWNARVGNLFSKIGKSPAELISARSLEMPWFQKRTPQHLPNEVIPEAIDDLEAARRIRGICEAAADIAKQVRNGASDSVEPERYERATKTAIQLALKISDGLLRDAAVREIIDVCVKANSLRTAEVLLGGIQAESIREAVLSDNPVLRPQS